MCIAVSNTINERNSLGEIEKNEVYELNDMQSSESNVINLHDQTRFKTIKGKKGYKLVSLNAHSLRRRHIFIDYFLSFFNIICINESWLKDYHSTCTIQ